jgi:putative oxidoreductase
MSGVVVHMSTGLLIIRVAIGAVMIAHGTQKLFGWFHGPGVDGFAAVLDQMGYPEPRVMAVVAGAAEAGGGSLLVVGFLTPFASMAAIGVMLNAILTVHWDRGFFNTNGGMEFPLLMLCVAAGLAFTGPGRAALDPALGLHLFGSAWGVGAILLGAGVGLLAYTSKAEPPSEMPHQGEEREAA